ncbi:protein of unknown function [Shewanella benthica]|uniref:Uncharacterized protein n=1 Tax=Shewanella benthica TaxID=43661 RepID=A0A330LXA2_9GAMM|nr:protein of unknown function [Shewanella benthica]
MSDNKLVKYLCSWVHWADLVFGWFIENQSFIGVYCLQQLL